MQARGAAAQHGDSRRATGTVPARFRGKGSVSVESGINIGDYVAMARRRWLVVVAPAIIGLVIAALIANSLPEKFRARARILVESQSIPEDLARSTVTSTPAERLRVIEQRLMTRSNLLDVAERFEVFGDRRMSPSAIVDSMRDSTNFASVPLARAGRGQVTASAIDIVFVADRARIASRVANEFVTLLLEENLRTRNESATDTLAFFTSEVERLGAELSAIEERIKRYKTENDLALPDGVELRRSERASIEARALERARRRDSLIAERLALEEAIRTGVSVGGGALTPQEQELERLRRQLIQSQTIYAPTHPTVRSLTAQIAALEQALGVASEEAQAAAEEEAEAAESRAVGEAQRRLDAIDRQLETLERQEALVAERDALLEAAIARAPQVELTLAALQRERDNIQIQHQQAVLKRAQAETGERLEVSRAAERFEVIEQAETPPGPFSPNRTMILAGGVAAGGALGLAIAVLLELLIQRIRTPRDLESRFQMRPIVSVPYIQTQREQLFGKLRARATVFAVLVLPAVAIYAVDQFYRPLPVIADQLGERIGVGALTDRLGE